MKRFQISIVLLCTMLFSVAPYAKCADAIPTDAHINQLLDAGNYTSALSELNATLKRVPASNASHIYYLIAGCYMKAGQAGDAVNVYRSIVSSYPTSNDAALAKVAIARALRQHPELAAFASTQSAAPARRAVTQPAAPATTADIADDDDDTPTASATPRAGTQQRVFGSKGSFATEAGFDQLADQSKFYYKPGPGGHMMVDGWVNNRPITMMFDTGATAHFGKNHLTALGIPLPQGPPDGRVSGWAGVEVPVWHIQADVRLGQITRRLPLTVEEHLNMEPLIGTDFTRGYELDFDNGAHCVLMHKGASKKQARQVDSLYDLPCMFRGHDTIVALEVNGKQCPVIIDTGAMHTIISADAIQELHIEIPDNAVPVTFGGVGGGTSGVTFPVNLRMGPITKHDFTITVGGMGMNAIGQDFMSGWRFSVDRDKHLVRFFH